MAMDESYLKSLAAFRERANHREVFINALSKIFTDVKLGGVRSCLAVGPGEGWYTSLNSSSTAKQMSVSLSASSLTTPRQNISEHL